METETQIQREKGYEAVGAETGVMKPQAKEHQGLRSTITRQRSTEGVRPLSLQREAALLTP